MNRINKTFEEKQDVLNIYFTAGFPKLNDTVRIASAIESAGADMLEIGIPFSDPVADGPTIQHSSKVALENGMTLSRLFEQLKELRATVSIPVLLMGYINPILQYGVEEFCKSCNEVGIDGLIIPDLPMQEFEDEYAALFAQSGLHNIFLISPNTSSERIAKVDSISNGFIYIVSSASITGAKKDIENSQVDYFERISGMGLKNPTLIGFGISNQETFETACHYSNGAIIGSAFINQLSQDASESGINNFIESIKGK